MPKFENGRLKFWRANPTCQTTALCNLNETPARVFALLNYNPIFIFVYIIMKSWIVRTFYIFTAWPRYITRQLNKHRDAHSCFTKRYANVFDIINYRFIVCFTSVFTVSVIFLLHKCTIVLRVNHLMKCLTLLQSHKRVMKLTEEQFSPPYFN